MHRANSVQRGENSRNHAPFAKACKPGLCDQTSHQQGKKFIIRKSNNTVNRNSCGHRPFINASAVLLGGVLGALLSQRLPERIRVSMTSIFGLASLGIGILTGGEMRQPSGDGLATLLGALIGEICLLEKASIPRSPKHKICFATHVRSQRMNLLFRIMSRLLSCFAPAAPGSSGR